jgi:ubiquitin thioesterase OTU1
VLGQSPLAYAAWILQPEKWGGEIEMLLLSRVLQVHIRAVEVQSAQIYCYDPLTPAEGSCILLLLYDGIHYDCLVRPGADGKAAQTLFPLAQDELLKGQCRRLAAELREAKRFTAVDDKAGSFQLRCLVCQQRLRHADDAREHAAQTGHQNFGQV